MSRLVVLFLFVVITICMLTKCSATSILSLSKGNEFFEVENLWKTLEIKRNPFLTMPYRDYRIPIYEHDHNNPKADDQLFRYNRYYYSPFPILDHSSATASLNNATGQAELKIRIELWNTRLEEEVASYLEEILGREIKLHQLQVVPFERILLTSRGQSMNQNVKHWTKYELEKTVWFVVPCQTIELCQTLSSKIRSEPDSFAEEFVLRFGLEQTLSLREQITLNIDEVVASIETYRQIRNDFGHHNSVFVSAETLERLISETVEHIEQELLNSKKVLISNILVRKQLQKIFAKNGQASVSELKNNLIYRPKSYAKPSKKNNDKTLEDEYFDEIETQETVPLEKSTSYYLINLDELEASSSDQLKLNLVYSYSMLSISVKVDVPHSPISSEKGKFQERQVSRNHGFTQELKKQLSEYEKQLNSQMEKTKIEVDHWLNGAKSEIRKLTYDMKRFKAQICPLHVGFLSNCESVPFFGCYCFSIEKKRSQQDATKFCEDIGMKLVSLDSHVEYEQLISIVNKDKRLEKFSYWTSGVRRRHLYVDEKRLPGDGKHLQQQPKRQNSAPWIWMGSGKAIANWNWMSNEPDAQEGNDYVVINYPTRHYQTYPSHASFYTICESRISWP